MATFGNKSYNINTTVPLGEEFEDDDAAWIMACIFIIFTMQTGYALMESGMCSLKNEVSIMTKNIIDVGIGGFVFWAFGYGIIYGESKYTSPVLGIGNFFFAPDMNKHGSGEEYLRFFMHCSYIANSNTIISGAMAERTCIKGYIVFCFMNAVLFCFPANWVWGRYGWLKQLGAIDVAGAGVVYGMGGFSALAGAWFLKPRLGKTKSRDSYLLGNAKNSLTGLFMIWWAFLAVNSVSTFGVTGDKWMFSARATVNTIISSFGGGFTSLCFSLIFFCGHVNVPLISNCVFGSLVAISGSSVLLSTIQSFIVGIISAHITFTSMMIIERSCIDDPCGAFAVHAFNGIWGLLSVGVFANRANAAPGLLQYNGLLQGESYLFGIQVLTSFVIIIWSLLSTYTTLWIINKFVPIRLDVIEELLGADYSDHNILHQGLNIEKAVDILKNFEDIATDLDSTGQNLGHMMYLENVYGKGHNKNGDESVALTRIFNVDVSSKDVTDYKKTHKKCAHSSGVHPRVAESGGFGRSK